MADRLLDGLPRSAQLGIAKRGYWATLQTTRHIRRRGDGRSEKCSNDIFTLIDENPSPSILKSTEIVFDRRSSCALPPPHARASLRQTWAANFYLISSSCTIETSQQMPTDRALAQAQETNSINCVFTQPRQRASSYDRSSQGSLAAVSIGSCRINPERQKTASYLRSTSRLKLRESDTANH